MVLMALMVLLMVFMVFVTMCGNCRTESPAPNDNFFVMFWQFFVNFW